MTIEEQMDIELILTEASAWGLQNEVEQSAKQFINEGHKAVDAYQYAYEDWVK
jgi:predicted transcriptional regulator